MQKFIAEDSFWELFPNSQIGILVARGMKNSEDVDMFDKEAIHSLLNEANKEAKHYLASDVISENEVVKVWREAYQKFKTKKGARCSVENLLKRVLKDNPVGPITPLVDIYNAISLKYALPVGGEDINAFVGNVRLGVTEGGDEFFPLGEEKSDPTLAGEVCYRDDAGAICRCWNWRDGQRTALTDTSHDAFLVMECVDPERAQDLRDALSEFAELMGKYLGASIDVKCIVDRENPEIALMK